MRLVIIMSGQRPGKFTAKYWQPSVLGSPNELTPVNLQGLSAWKLEPLTIEGSSFLILCYPTLQRKKQSGEMTHGILSSFLLHSWAFRSAVHLSREMENPFQSKGGGYSMILDLQNCVAAKHFAGITRRSGKSFPFPLLKSLFDQLAWFKKRNMSIFNRLTHQVRQDTVIWMVHLFTTLLAVV